MSDTSHPSDPTNTDSEKYNLEFSNWSELAISDPEAFEEMREQIIEEFIQSAPESKHQRLRQLQWRIDQTRKLSRNPLDACIKLSHLMMESVYGQNGLLDALKGVEREVNGNTAPHSEKPCKKAKILKFNTLTTSPEIQ